MGMILLICPTQLTWYARRQPAWNNSTDAEFTATKLAVEEAVMRRQNLRSMEVKVEKPSLILGDNHSVIISSTKPDTTSRNARRVVDVVWTGSELIHSQKHCKVENTMVSFVKSWWTDWGEDNSGCQRDSWLCLPGGGQTKKRKEIQEEFCERDPSGIPWDD